MFSVYPECCKIIADKTGWLKELKDKPFASYYEQLEKAEKRNDLVSVNHRVAAFLASYFDIIFAQNEILHPGEKRLVQYVLDNCKIIPEDFEKDVNELTAGLVSEKLKTAGRMVEILRETIKI